MRPEARHDMAERRDMACRDIQDLERRVPLRFPGNNRIVFFQQAQPDVRIEVGIEQEHFLLPHDGEDLRDGLPSLKCHLNDVEIRLLLQVEVTRPGDRQVSLWNGTMKSELGHGPEAVGFIEPRLVRQQYPGFEAFARSAQSKARFIKARYSPCPR